MFNVFWINEKNKMNKTSKKTKKKKLKSYVVLYTKNIIIETKLNIKSRWWLKKTTTLIWIIRTWLNELYTQTLITEPKLKS